MLNLGQITWPPACKSLKQPHACWTVLCLKELWVQFRKQHRLYVQACKFATSILYASALPVFLCFSISGPLACSEAHPQFFPQCVIVSLSCVHSWPVFQFHMITDWWISRWAKQQGGAKYNAWPSEGCGIRINLCAHQKSPAIMIRLSDCASAACLRIKTLSHVLQPCGLYI